MSSYDVDRYMQTGVCRIGEDWTSMVGISCHVPAFGMLCNRFLIHLGLFLVRDVLAVGASIRQIFCCCLLLMCSWFWLITLKPLLCGCLDCLHQPLWQPTSFSSRDKLRNACSVWNNTVSWEGLHRFLSMHVGFMDTACMFCTQALNMDLAFQSAMLQPICALCTLQYQGMHMNRAVNLFAQ